MARLQSAILGGDALLHAAIFKHKWKHILRLHMEMKVGNLKGSHLTNVRRECRGETACQHLLGSDGEKYCMKIKTVLMVLSASLHEIDRGGGGGGGGGSENATVCEVVKPLQLHLLMSCYRKWIPDFKESRDSHSCFDYIGCWRHV